MWINQRLGLIMIVASLVVMGLIVYISSSNQLDLRITQARSQGVGLAKLFSSMSWAELVPEKGHRGILQVFRQGQNNPDFAYAVVVNLQGQKATEASAPGVIIPDQPIPDNPVAWLGERKLEEQSSGQKYLEFHAPVFSKGKLRGYIRIGYKQPEFNLNYNNLPYFGMLTLPVFLLLPVFYFLVRRETRPLRAINDNIETLLEHSSTASVELHPSGELSDFIERFSSFIKFAQQRIQVLEQEQKNILTSSKLLSYRNAKIESILHTLPEAILIIDESGNVTYVNEKIISLLGISQDSILGKKASEWCKDHKMSSYLSRHNNISKQVGFISNSIHITPENSPNKILEVKAYPLFSPNDGSILLGNMVVIRDATEEQIARQNRSEFIAQIAHELKTPLNVLSMYSELLLGEEGNSEEFRIEAVNIIYDETERLSTLINNMLAISKFEMGNMQLKRQRVRIGELLQDILTNLSQSDRGRHLKFELDVEHEMSTIFVDKDLLRIAINNLLTNAIKYNKTGGLVILKARERDDIVEISVKDSGIGIKEDEIPRIFDKFYRSDDEKTRSQTGHGLGLSLVQQIVYIHHGKIKVASELGKGTTFTIQLDKYVEMQQQGVA